MLFLDFVKWGQEYLSEALNIKAHMLPVKEKLKHASGNEAAALYRRAAMLEQMYLECTHIGNSLKKRGGSFAENEAAQP
jgi:hypothetical protein